MRCPFAVAVRRSLIVWLLLVMGSASAIAGTASPDTLRTNLWMTESLLREILHEGVSVLPDDGMPVLLTPRGRHPGLDLMRSLAAGMVDDAGHQAVLMDELGDDEPLAQPPAESVPYELRFSLEDVRLEYPRVGRRLGLWRSWVDRDLEVSGQVTVRDRRSGMLLMDDRLARSFSDRLPAGRLDALETPAFAFTSAEPDEGGIPAVFEEVVVLGALVGLVAAYFATTAD